MCAGISLYGVASSSGDETRLYLDLRPALALKAKVVLIRDVPKGEFVGYGRAYQTPMDSQIAILPIGYADGLPINLSGAEASVEIGGYQPSSFVRSRKAIQIPRNRELDYPDGGVVYFRSSCFSICTLATHRVFFRRIPFPSDSIFGHEIRAIFEAFAKGDNETAKALFIPMYRFCKSTGQNGRLLPNPIMRPAIELVTGIKLGPARSPLVPATEEETEITKAILKEIGKI